MSHSEERPIIVLFDRLGPYHWARLEACSNLFPTVAIEISARSDTYAWDRIDGAANFERVTLFPNQTSALISTAKIQQAVANALSRRQPRLVAIPGWAEPAALAALEWCHRTRTPAVMMSESTEDDAERSSWKEWIKRQVVGSCGAALVGGTPHKKYVIKLGMKSDHVSFGYDAVDNAYFAEKTSEIRAKRQEVREAPYFLASARFVEKKNLARLLEAYQEYRVRASARPWNLVLLGDGPLRPALEAKVLALGIERHVFMPGFVQYAQLPAFYASAGAFVHASTVEQWGLVVNEAMASRLPVLVSSRCGCAPDLVQVGVNGFIFDPHNQQDFVEKLLRTAELSCDQRRVLGEAGFERIHAWSPRRFAEGLQECAHAVSREPIKPTLLSRAVIRALLTNIR